MEKLFFLTILCVLGLALCFPSDYVIIDSSIPVRDCELEREEIIEEPDIINSNEYNSYSGEEPVSTSSIEEIKFRKRDLESKDVKKQVSISDIISNVEDSLLSSAYHVNNIYHNVTKAKNNETDSDLTTETATTDRLKREGSNSKNGDSESTTAYIEIVKSTEQDTNSTYKMKPKAVISHLVAHDVPVTDEKPAHLVVNHVAVYVPPKDHVSVLPSFGLKLNGEKHEAIKELENKTTNNLRDDTDTRSTTQFIQDSTGFTIPTTIKTDCDTQKSTDTDSINCHLTTPKTPVEKLKEVEEHIKEKAAEIEADPVILSSRV